jgi:nucleoside 2-deoxyribosyltransferase
MVRVYLAGPEVFLLNAREALDRKIVLTRNVGLEPVSPGDLEIPPAPTKRRYGENISRINEQLMTSADAIIANLTPFRGLHADPGTVFELGFMCGLGKAAFAYSNVIDDHYQRVLAYYGGQVSTAPDGRLRGPDGLSVEDFGMNENLMLDGAIAARGGAWVNHDAPAGQRLYDTTAFERVLIIAAEKLLGQRFPKLN